MIKKLCKLSRRERFDMIMKSVSRHYRNLVAEKGSADGITVPKNLVKVEASQGKNLEVKFPFD